MQLLAQELNELVLCRRLGPHSHEGPCAMIRLARLPDFHYISAPISTFFEDEKMPIRVAEWGSARRTALVLGSTVICLAFGSAGVASAQKARVIAPECGPVFGSRICVGGTARGNEIRSITATVPLSVIQGAPPPGAMKWPPQSDLVLALPAEIQTATGVTELTFYWEAMGHPPGPFLTPHFDFHFYVVSEAERRAMDCKNDTKPESLPTGYSLLDVDIPGIGLLKGLCVPLMGMHSLLGAEAKATKPFKSTLVMGFYNGKPIFFEPMIARATLLDKKSFSLSVPSPSQVPANVHYPRHFKATYDKSSNGYLFEFTEFR